jgi:hypothetical protein
MSRRFYYSLVVKLSSPKNLHCLGGVWNGATTPKLCGFSSANCLTAGGTPRNGQCSTTQAEFNGTPFNAQSCRQASGVWITGKLT